jgi:nucleotide-binding universal stress UspA family protein
MSVFRKILVPTDYSSIAREAFRVADDLARPTGASVVMFHVSRPQAVNSTGDQRPSPAVRVDGINPSDELRPNQTRVPSVRIEHEMMVAERPDAEHILQTVEECGCDVIVMGTRVRAGRKGRLLSSMTENVMRKARCPVILVAAPAEVAEDFSSSSLARTATRAVS